MTPWSFLFFSILVHILVWLLIIANQHPMPKPKDNIEVTIVKQKDAFRPSQVVRQADVPKEMLTDKKQKAKFLSEKDQFVKEEMKSKNSGLTQNKKSDAIKKPSQQQSQKEAGKPVKDPLDLGDFGEKKSPTLADLTPAVAPEVSQTSDQMDNVKNGSMTALNEERFTYYSFFSRIEERVVPLWERNLRNTQSRMRPEDVRRAMDHVFVTEIEVLLDAKGYYLGTILAKSSGNTEIDSDGIAAFKEAHYFPNPPQEMVKEDGRIHLQYSLSYSLYRGFGP